MTPSTFAPHLMPPLFRECVDCGVIDTQDGATKRCRPCWRAWRWSPVGWVKEQETKELTDYLVKKGGG